MGNWFRFRFSKTRTSRSYPGLCRGVLESGMMWAAGAGTTAAVGILLRSSLRVPSVPFFAPRVHPPLMETGRSSTGVRGGAQSSPHHSSTAAASGSSRNSRRGGGGGGRRGGRGGASGGAVENRIDALGRLLTRILRHMAAELNLNIRDDGYVKVHDLLLLNITTHAKVSLKSHTVDEIKEAVRRDNKQRFSLLEENGELLIRANQGHTIETISSESLLQPILSAESIPVCVHGTYKKNLESILAFGLKRMQRLHVHFASGLPTDGEVISGMRQSVNVLIFLDVRKAMEDGMKFYLSDNRVILTEGFDGVVPVKYFEKIETWPKREAIPF